MAVSIRASLLIAAAALTVIAATAAFGDPPASEVVEVRAHPVHWSYSGEGGPDHWAETAENASACATGREQSPINLSGAINASVAVPDGHWTPVRGGIVLNNGHTIEVDVDGAGGVDLDGATYKLKQFHFHHPSEHTIEGRSFPLELHMVHASADGRLAVVGVMFEEGAPLPALDPVWATAPGREGKAAVAFEIDAAKLIPENRAAYRYQGSLTTPPCSETVSWTVMATPVTASHSQIEAFAALFPNNARPVQPINRRFVLKAN